MSVEDLNVAARAAHFIASTATTIHSLETGPTRNAKSTKNLITEIMSALNQNYPEARKAIGGVVMMLRRTRNSIVRLGDISATTAHEAALEMVLLLNRDHLGFEGVGHKSVQDWPDASEVSAEIEFELARAKDLHASTGGDDGQHATKSSTPFVPEWLGNGKVHLHDRVVELDPPLAAALSALVQLRAATTDKLANKSKLEDPGRALRKLVKKFPELALHIIFPGRKGRGGYSTTIKEAPPISPL